MTSQHYTHYSTPSTTLFVLPLLLLLVLHKLQHMDTGYRVPIRLIMLQALPGAALLCTGCGARTEAEVFPLLKCISDTSAFQLAYIVPSSSYSTVVKRHCEHSASSAKR